MMVQTAQDAIELLIVQPTPFCNLNCSYCYLPDRRVTRRMSDETLVAVMDAAFASDRIGNELTFVWHAGEPLVMPIAFYRRARELSEARKRPGALIRHSFQTNGTLINDAWCEFFNEPGVAVGVSVDGPAALHDSRRRTWDDKGTHERVMAGVAKLREHNVPFHVISVLTSDALDQPDEMYAFYRDNGIRSVGFNVEEIEGPNTESSLAGGAGEARFRAFLGRFFDLVTAEEDRLRVREFEGAIQDLTAPAWRPLAVSQEARPFGIVSIDIDGNISTFSPELLGATHAAYDTFTFGNVRDGSLDRIIESAAYRRAAADITAGVEKCRATCAYFGSCGGGAPANKLFENGTFNSTETMFCRLNKQLVVDVVRERLERDFTRVALSAPLAQSAADYVDTLADSPSSETFAALARGIAAELRATGVTVPDDTNVELIGVAPSQAVRVRNVSAAVNLADDAIVRAERSCARVARNAGVALATPGDVVLPMTDDTGLWLVLHR